MTMQGLQRRIAAKSGHPGGERELNRLWPLACERKGTHKSHSSQGRWWGAVAMLREVCTTE